MRKIEYYDKLGQTQTVDDLENGTIPEDKLSTMTDKPITITFYNDIQKIKFIHNTKSNFISNTKYCF
mgnify:CR=1 FL=1